MSKLIILFVIVVGLRVSAVAQQTDSTAISSSDQRDVVEGQEESDLRTDDIRYKDEARQQETDKASQAGRTIEAQLKDEKLESKEGPDGEPVFVSASGQYYYIDKNGEKVIVAKSELKVKK